MKSCILRNTWQIKPTEYHAYIAIYLLKKILCRAGDFETYSCPDRGLMGQLCPAFIRPKERVQPSSALVVGLASPHPFRGIGIWDFKYLIWAKHVLMFTAKIELQSCDLSGNGGCGHYVVFRQPVMALSLTQFSSHGVSCLFYFSWACSLWNLSSPVLLSQCWAYSSGKASCYSVRSSKKIATGLQCPIGKTGASVAWLVTLGWKLCWQHRWGFVTDGCLWEPSYNK